MDPVLVPMALSRLTEIDWSLSGVFDDVLFRNFPRVLYKLTRLRRLRR